ncbi:hypothetical protein AB95_3496 [Escherichia coli 7-233-03_S3_C1]|nr:hypothetical protein AB95_3496 [Escherichia coli 7-233-03_S3_C1]
MLHICRRCRNLQHITGYYSIPMDDIGGFLSMKIRKSRE